MFRDELDIPSFFLGNAYQTMVFPLCLSLVLHEYGIPVISP